MSFMDEKYELPTSNSNYTKFDGEVKLRVLGRIYTGYEYYDVNKKPHRQKNHWTKTPEDIAPNQFDPSKKTYPKHFRACKVYNYNTKLIEVCLINKKSMQEDIMNFINNPEYGEINGYDILCIKKGKDKDTKYSVMPSPPKPVSEEIAKLDGLTVVDISELYTGGNPFAPDTNKDTDSEDFSF